jgi:cbb3-type cytochrome oxidase subunit 1
MRASSLGFCAAVCLGIVGMGIGIAMAASGDHSVFPAHAHLNLLGWVSLFLMGGFYRLHPALDESRIARIQAGIWICATIVLTIGVAGIYLGRSSFELVATIGAVAIIIDMILFAYLVFRSELGVSHYPRVMAPAE